MAMIRYSDVNQQMRAQQRAIVHAEGEVETAAGRALRSMLGNMLDAAQPLLTASSLPTPFGTGELFTLGQVRGWWSDAVDEDLTRTLLSTWSAGYRATSDLPMVQGSFDEAGSYVANVRDRLSVTQSPLIADQAFDIVRVGLIEEMSIGSSTDTIARRIASDLNWRQPDVGFWEERRDFVRRELDDILDEAGPVGSSARESLRLNDPQVRELQRLNSEAVRRLDADESTWRKRARTIARTETTGAWNAGALDAAVREGQQVKVWLTLGDGLSRDTHLEAAGQCVDVDGDFNVGGYAMPSPGIGGPAEEVVNCRCMMLFADSCETGAAMAAPAFPVWDEQADERGLSRVPSM